MRQGCWGGTGFPNFCSVEKIILTITGLLTCKIQGAISSAVFGQLIPWRLQGDCVQE